MYLYRKKTITRYLKCQEELLLQKRSGCLKYQTEELGQYELGGLTDGVLLGQFVLQSRHLYIVAIRKETVK